MRRTRPTRINFRNRREHAENGGGVGVGCSAAMKQINVSSLKIAIIGVIDGMAFQTCPNTAIRSRRRAGPRVRGGGLKDCGASRADRREAAKEIKSHQ
jgi:hypothetical protein